MTSSRILCDAAGVVVSDDEMRRRTHTVDHSSALVSFSYRCPTAKPAPDNPAVCLYTVDITRPRM